MFLIEGAAVGQAAAVEEGGSDEWHAAEFSKNSQTFVVAEVGLDVGGFLGAQGVYVAEGHAENFPVEEKQGLEGLILRRGGDLSIGRKMNQELLDMRRAHGGGVAEFVKADVPLVPRDVGFFGADGVSPQTDGFAEAVGEFLFWHSDSSLDFPVS